MRMLLIVSLTIFSGCTVHDELEDLKTLRVRCANLQADLAEINAKILPKNVDGMQKLCVAQGWWK